MIENKHIDKPKAYAPSTFPKVCIWTEICEINQNFKGDLIKFCEILTKITLELSQNNQKALILMYETCDKHNKM